MRINDSFCKGRLTAALHHVCLLTLLMNVATTCAEAQDEEGEFNQIAALLRVSNGSRVADVGAGGGAWTVRLAERVGAKGHVFSTEVRQELVGAIGSSVRARGLNNVTVILGDQDNIGLPVGSCDAVLLRLVYHAFKNPGRMRNNLREAVRIGGVVLIIDFRPPAQQLVKEMREAGYDAIQSVEKWQGQEGVYAVLFKRRE